MNLFSLQKETWQRIKLSYPPRAERGYVNRVVEKNFDLEECLFFQNADSVTVLLACGGKPRVDGRQTRYQRKYWRIQCG